MSTDIEAIRALTYTYAFHNDAGEFDELGRLFTRGRLVIPRSPGHRDIYEGNAAVSGFYAERVLLYDGSPRTRHDITNLRIELAADGAHAEAQSYFTVLQAVPGGSLEVIAAGRYHDRFEQDAGSWHFTEKVIHGDYFGDLSRHFTGP